MNLSGLSLTDVHVRSTVVNLLNLFNCGVGMVLAVAGSEADAVTQRLEAAGETVVQVGAIATGERGCTVRGAAGVWSARGDWEAVHNA
mgnify:CR=1 FL=1